MVSVLYITITTEQQCSSLSSNSCSIYYRPLRGRVAVTSYRSHFTKDSATKSTIPFPLESSINKRTTANVSQEQLAFNYAKVVLRLADLAIKFNAPGSTNEDLNE